MSCLNTKKSENHCVSISNKILDIISSYFDLNQTPYSIPIVYHRQIMGNKTFPNSIS